MLNESVESLASDSAYLALAQQARSGANWFYWVAGLSVVNSAINFFGGSLSFVVGLGATLFVDAIAGMVVQDSGSSFWLIIGFVIDLIIVVIFLGFGLFANRLHRWAFVIGMILYVGDGLLYLLIQDWWSLAFHAFVLFNLWKGLSAVNQIRILQSQSVDTL